MNTLQLLLCDTFGFHKFKSHVNFSFTADHPDISCRCCGRPLQHLLVLLMPSRYDDDVRSAINTQSPGDGCNVFGNSLIGFGKSFGISELRPVVNDSNVEIHHFTDSCQEE